MQTDDHQQLALAEVQASVPKEGCRQVLPKEDNVRFHQASVLLTQRLPAAWALLSAKHRLAQLLCWHALSVPHAAGRVEAAWTGQSSLALPLCSLRKHTRALAATPLRRYAVLRSKVPCAATRRSEGTPARRSRPSMFCVKHRKRRPFLSSVEMNRCVRVGL